MDVERERRLQRKLQWQRSLEAVRDGRKHRSVTIPNKKKQAQVDACRKRKDEE